MSDRLNFPSTFFLIFALLLMMLAGGTMSAYVGFLMGTEALKVVTQPDTNSKEPVSKSKTRAGSHKGLKIIDEREVLINVYNRKHYHNQKNRPQNKSAQQSLEPSQSSLVNHEAGQKNIPTGFVPVKDSSDGVTIEVSQAKFHNSSLILGLNLKNESSNPVRFLYSFMDVRDDNNRSLSAMIEGLPANIPPNGKEFQGNLIVPLSLLNNSRNISLTLKDYPEQKLELKLEKIATTR